MYTPAPADVFRPGLLGDNDQVRSTIQQTAEAYLDYGPPIFYGAVSLSTTSDSDELVAEFDLPANEDQCPIYFKIVWRGTDTYTATMTLQLVGNVVDDEVVTRTSSSWGSITRTITPTSVGDDRLARIYLRQSSDGQIAQIAFIGIGYAPQGMSHPSGAQPSGYVSTSEWENGWDTDQSVPSELVQRALNNMAYLARDRPAGLAGGVSRIDTGGTPTPGPVYETTSSTWETVERWLQPGSDIGLRWYRLTAVLEAGVDCRIMIGSCIWEFEGEGRHSTVVQISLGEAEEGTIALRGSGRLVSWQMMRAAPPVEHPEVTAAYFSDGAGYLACDAFSFLFAGGAFVGCTLSFWVRTTETDAFLVDAGMIGGPRFSVQLDGGTAFASMASDGNADYADEYGGPVADDDWHHVLVMTRNESVFSPPGLHVFVDGVSGDDGTGGITGTFANEPEWRLLRNFEDDDEVEGFISNIAIFPFVRPYPENYLLAASLYAAGRHHNPRNPTGRWRGGRAAGQWIDPIGEDGQLLNRGYAEGGTFYQGGASDVLNVTGDE